MTDEDILQDYILITPVKNEEESIFDCIQSIVRQTIRPSLWLFIDDGSTDNTPKIINETMNQYQWIKNIVLEKSDRNLGVHYSFVCRKGFDFIIEYCQKNGIKYDYVGLLDADMILEENFFEYLLRKFENDSSLGIASGSTWYIDGDQIRYAKQREDLPSGAGRLWRKKCFEETGGYQLTHAADSVSNIKAILKGWSVRRFKDIKAIQTRKTSSAEGLWNGWRDLGRRAHYVGTGPTFALLKSIRYSFENPYYIGLAYFIGYLSSWMYRKEQINDEEVKNYYQTLIPQKHKNYYLNKIKNWFK
ncbi:glycosyltransferase [Methanosarcina sp.]|uniref:glycosyltransferase n=1 Tax=Methanosarcina sp. TaxID=2213 RepID=UPI003BB5E628